MPPYGSYGPFPSYGFFPSMPMMGGGFPPYFFPYPACQPMSQMMGYPGALPAVAPAPMPAQYPYASPYAVPRGRMKTGYILLIVLGVLLLVGGAVAAVVLATGGGNSSFNLGDGSVTGADIEFQGLVLAQEGNQVTLTGTYDNNTKREGDVYVTVQAISGGNEELLSFTVPVEPGTNQTFTQRKAASGQISGATLGALVYQGTSRQDDDEETDTYPWDSGTETSPEETSPETSPGGTSPERTSPINTPYY